MKFLQIIPHYLPAHRFGGPLRVAHSLGCALQKQGHEISVLTTNQSDEHSNLNVQTGVPVTIDGIKVFYEPTFLFRYWGFSPKLFLRAIKLIKDADIVIVHAHYQFSNWAGAFLSRYLKKPYIIFSHGSLHIKGIEHKNAIFKKWYLRILEKKNFERSLFIAFNAEEEKSSSLFNEFGRVIPNGIDPSEFSTKPPAGDFLTKFDIPTGKTTFLFLGRLDVAHKGLDLLIPAFEKLVKQSPNNHLIIAGPDEDGGLDTLTKLIHKHHLEHHVTFTGLISGSDKYAALQDADVFVLPSRFEGLSIALLEALYFGLPMLVTDQVGLCETIKQRKAGIVIPATNDAALLAALQQMADPALRRQFVGRGTEIVLEKFTWDAIATFLVEEIRTHPNGIQ